MINLWVILIPVLAATIGARVATAKQRDPMRWGIACLLLPLLLLVLLFLGPGDGVPSGYRRCPHCAEPIHNAANVCRHCRNDVTPVQQTADHATRPCPHCGADMDNGAHMCMSCGKSLSF